MLLALEHHPNGPRVRILGQRIHHGAVGTLLAIHPRTRRIGLVLCMHDAHDLAKWFRPGPQFEA